MLTDYRTRADRRLKVLHIPGRGGGGPVLVFLHGACARMGQFSEQIDYFAARGEAVLAIDNVGCGRSEKPSCESAYAVESFVADCVEVISEYVPRGSDVVLIGHSFGTYLVMRVAPCLQAYRVKGAVLIAGGPLWLEDSAALKIFALPNAVLWLIRPILSKGFRKRALAPGAPEQLVRQELEASSRNPVYMFASFYRHLRQLSDARHWPDLSAQPAAPLLIAGGHDKLIPVCRTRKLASMFKDPSLKIIENASHQCMQEQPAVVNDYISAYISR
eukprot:gene12135-18755_t